MLDRTLVASTMRRPSLAFAIVAAVYANGCAFADGQPSHAEDGVGAVRAPVLHGATGIDSDYTAVVRIWAVNQQFDELRQFCTGVLLTNDVVITAAHCLRFTQEAIDYGWPDVQTDVSPLLVTTDQLGFEAAGVGEPAFAPDGRDLAVFKLSGKLPVWSRGEVVESGFFHDLAGTPDPDATLAVIGYGPTERNVTSTICNYVSLESGERIPGCMGDRFVLNYGVGTYISNGAEIISNGVTSTGGDSGGPTVVVADEDISELGILGINSLASRCVPLGSRNCGTAAARVDDLHTWFAVLGM